MNTTSAQRPSPIGKRVSLFVTCMVDMLSPQTGLSVIEVLQHLGVEVDFPYGQTCCGQPAFNGGYRREARSVARHFMEVFRDAEVIVIPSGSCTAMLRHEYPRLFEDDPQARAEAERLAAITWEFTEFIVDGLGLTDLQAQLPTPKTLVCHHACHGLRLLKLGQGAEKLVNNIDNATVHDWGSSEICCGFGGFFSVKMADISGAILQKKLNDIEQSGVDMVVTGDISCLLHMNGGLQKQGQEPSVRHIADVLAESIRGAS